MSPDQRSYLLRLWSAACKHQGWDRAHGLNSAAVNGLRKSVTEKVFGEPKSWKEINWREDYGRIKNHLLMLGGNVQGTIETDRPDMDEKRRLLTFIEGDLMRCLALYRPAERYVQDILRDGFRIYSGKKTIEDLSAAPRPPREGEDKPRASQLKCLIYTLSARINELRNQAGDSVHDMRTRAGVPCVCADCCRGRLREEVAAEVISQASDLEGETQAAPVGEEAMSENPF